MVKNSCDSMLNFVIGIAFGVIIVVGVLLTNNNENVNVVELGERFCESKGLVYHKYEMIKDKQGYSTVPKIYCKKNELSVYDGVVVLGE